MACALIFATGCTHQEQQQVANTTVTALDKAGNAATNALDTTADVISDVSITGTVKTKIVSTKSLPAGKIDVSTKDNIVALDGTVQNAAQKNLAGQLARDTPGVKGVTNRLIISK
jgi:osmotically-inducible protein OsmY